MGSKRRMVQREVKLRKLPDLNPELVSHFPNEALERKLSDAQHEAARMECPSLYRALWEARAKQLDQILKERSAA